jgi:hypothetical protein
MASTEKPGSSSGLGFLEDVANLVDRPPKRPLCERCREERRFLGAALLSEFDEFLD